MKYIKSLYIILYAVLLFVFDVVVCLLGILVVALIGVPFVSGCIVYYQTKYKLKGIK